MAKLSEKIIIKGKITLLSGLHIGGSNMGMEVGGVNATVVRNPISNEPYIPGSSLKGKIRSLLEQKYGVFTRLASNVPHGPTDRYDHVICKMFGNAKGDNKNIPSKAIFRDSRIHGVDKLKKVKTFDLPFTEVKTEVVIDRIRSTAVPRQLERVPAGVEFNLEIVLNVWEDTMPVVESTEGSLLEVITDTVTTIPENEDEIMHHLPHKLTSGEMLDLLFAGFTLLENDFLGGKGSRGSGQVKIGIESISNNYLIPTQFKYDNSYAAPIYGYQV